MARRFRWMALLIVVTLVGVALISTASPPIFTEDVTDYGRNPWRTHYTPTEPEFPRARDARPVWEVPLGLSRTQPLVVQRDFSGDGNSEVRIYHIAGDRLWALNGDITPAARAPGQSVEHYRQQLIAEGFILWSTPAEALCTTAGLRGGDPLLDLKCRSLGPRPEKRPFSSSQAAYAKGAHPSEDILYVGFGHPASVVAIRAHDGKMLGGYMVDAMGDRGIVGAPLVYPDDTVVIGTTSGEAYIVKGLATGRASVRGLRIGGRISFSPVPVGSNAFIIASDARWSESRGNHGYMMAYGLAQPGRVEFSPRWPAAVVTPAGIPAEAAIDAGTVYFADKFGRLYALRLDNGELLWCRQYPALGPCTGSGAGQPGFINNGPGIDENHVYFVFRNNEGPNQGPGHVVALDKATGNLVWQQPIAFRGNTAPVPMGCL
jgi:outer membrane protein assembly factor BamB